MLMNIYVFANTILFHSSISGGDVVLPQMVKRWRKKYDVHLITTAEGKEVWENVGARVTFHLLPETSLDRSDDLLLGPLKYIVRTFQSIWIARRLISKESGKFILYSPGDFLPDTLPQFLFRLFYGDSRWVAWVYHLISPPWERKGNFFFNLFSYILQKSGLVLIKWKADVVPVLGGTYKDLIDLGFPEDKLLSSAVGVSTKVIKGAKPVSESYDAVHVGTLTFTKGVYDLLEIWKKVCSKKPTARLAVVGGGSKKLVKNYRKQIVEMGLEKNINYYGFVPRSEDVYSIIKSSRIYVCPGHENGWSLPVAEAMTAGVPTVAYNLKMFGTAFKRGFVTVPLFAKEKFASSVLELLANEKRRAALAQEALEESKNFDWQNIAENLSSVIGRL